MTHQTRGTTGSTRSVPSTPHSSQPPQSQPAPPRPTKFIFSLVPTGQGTVRGSGQDRTYLDTQVFTIDVSRVDGQDRGQSRRGPSAFDFSPATSRQDNTLPYHLHGDPPPHGSDLYLQLWELDIWEEVDPRADFDHWYRRGEEDSLDRENDLIAVLPGFLQQVREGQQDRYEFICNDDSHLVSPNGSEPYLTITYKKVVNGELQVVDQKRLTIPGESESWWEIGVCPSARDGEEDRRRFKNVAYRHHVQFIESMRNLVRNQLAEGGLSVAFFADFNQPEDLPILDKYRHFERQLRNAIQGGMERALSFLQDLQARLPRETNVTGPSAIFPRPEEEIEWRAVRAASACWIGPSYEETEREPLARVRERFHREYSHWDGQSKPWFGARPATDCRFTFTEWMTHARSAIDRLSMTGSESDLLQDFVNAFGQDRMSLVVDENRRNDANLCGSLRGTGPGNVLDSIEESSSPEIRSAHSGRRIYDVQNDCEFPGNAAGVSKEFGLLCLGEDGHLRKGAFPLRDSAEQGRESILINLEHIRDVVASPGGPYADLLPQGAPPKIYRLVIFTHGDRTAGFRYGRNDQDWYGLRLLRGVEPDRVHFIDRLSTLLGSGPRADQASRPNNAIVTLYACSTGANPSPLADYYANQIDAEQETALQSIVQTVPRGAERDRQLRETRARFGSRRNRLREEVRGLSDTEKILISYGGNPHRQSDLRNLLGTGSLAEALRDALFARGVQADVWAHCDEGHTSRNARLRVFFAPRGSTNQGEPHAEDLVRLVFNAPGEPSAPQIRWWWNRGEDSGDNPAPLEHQHAVKKAALCAYDSIDDPDRPFSLKRIIEDFRGWFASQPTPSPSRRPSESSATSPSHPSTARQARRPAS
jgi:hypothetical protein